MPALRYFVPGGWGFLRSSPHPDRARRDAETLLLHVIDKDKAWLLAHLDDELSEDLAALFTEWVRRRHKGEPIQYILGKTEFYGLPFRVTPDVLIPRPETEHLVEKAIELAGSFAAPRIVDVGTGSGAIAVGLAHHLPSAQITATDLSDAALAIAQENARASDLAERIRFLNGDLLAPVAGETFDLVVSNPPYVPSTERSSLSVEVRDYEPEVALFAGNDGLDVYRRLIPAAFAVLSSNGFLLLEIGHGQAEVVGQLLRSTGFDDIDFAPDLQGIARVASASRP